MKSQTTLHLESAVSHLKRACSMSFGQDGGYTNVEDWLRTRATMLDRADWSDQEEEAQILFALADFFHYRAKEIGEATSG